MKFLALLSSVPFESDKILAYLKNIRITKIGGRTVYKGKLLNINVLLMNTGIGKVNAAHSATGIIEKFPIRGVINLGVGGAYPKSGLKIGDIVIASKEIYGDEGIITSKGRDRENLKSIDIPLVQTGKRKYFNEFPLDKNFFKKAVKSFSLLTLHASHLTKLNPAPPLLSCESKKRGCGVKSGSFVTVSAATGTHKRAVELERRFNAICENMEGAAIAQVCTIYKIPMLEIRGISNIVGVRDRRKWDLDLASENCQKAVLKIVSIQRGKLD